MRSRRGPEIQGAAQGLRRLQVGRPGGPAAAHEQIERQRPAKDMVVVELRRGHHLPPPARRPERREIQAAEEEEPGLRLPHPGEQGRQCGLPAPRRPFEEEAVPPPHLQATRVQHWRSGHAVAKGQGVCRQYGRRWRVLLQRVRGQGVGRRSLHLRARGRRKERGHLAPCEHGTCQMPQRRREFLPGFIRQQDPADADRHGDGRNVARDQGRSETEQPDDEPATGDARREPRGRAVKPA